MGFFPFAPLPVGASQITVPLDLQTTAGSNPVFGAGTNGDAFNRVQLNASGSIQWGSGAGAVDTTLSRSSVGNLLVGAKLSVGGGAMDVTGVGFGLQVAEGSNAKQGTATLTAGTVTVANTSVTANSRIFLTGQVLGGTAGGLNVTSRTAGTSFVVTSTNAADTSTFAYEIFEPG